MPQPQPLTFEEFSKRDSSGIPRYNNLIIYFMETDLGRIMREQSSFQRFQKEHQDLERKLRDAMNTIDLKSPKISEELKPHNEDFYNFYIVMRDYGLKDDDLIGGI